MAKRSEAPKFGNWEDEDIPYTIYFGNATKDKTGKANSSNSPDKQAIKSKHERRTSREEAITRRLTESPLHHGVSGQRTPKQDRNSSSNEYETKKTVNSPLHHRGTYYQARTGEKSSGVSSPSWEKKKLFQGGSHGLAPATPQRSRLRPGNETPDRATVPKFGDWDETDPSSAEYYSRVFTQLRDEKQTNKVSESETHSSIQVPSDNDRDTRGCCCYPWARR